ncbi:MAG: GNAT family N-acetyltransferase [Anaerolineales bacterium]|nr:GNAT family N-acetyltransferase [Anaerolineales bacterium]
MQTATINKQKRWTTSHRPHLTEQSQPRVRARLQLVLASRRDYPAVASLFQALHTYNTSLDQHFALAENWEGLLREHFYHTYQRSNSLWLLAKKNGQAIGLLIASVHSDSPIFHYNHWVEIEALYIAPAYQGQGIAQRLMAQAYTWARERGANRIQLYVTATNVKARTFYAQQGFVVSQEIQRKSL